MFLKRLKLMTNGVLEGISKEDAERFNKQEVSLQNIKALASMFAFIFTPHEGNIGSFVWRYIDHPAQLEFGGDAAKLG